MIKKIINKIICLFLGHDNFYIESNDPDIHNICQRCHKRL